MGTEEKKDGVTSAQMRLKITKSIQNIFLIFVDFYLKLWYSENTKFILWGFTMFCKNCGQQIADGAAFCPNCGAAVTQPDATQTPYEQATNEQGAAQPQQQPYTQPQQPYTPPQQPYGQYPGYGMPQVSQEPASGGLRFLCWLIPLVGIILYFVKKDEKPVYAKQCGVAALVGIIMAVVFYIIYFVVIGLAVAGGSYYY